MLRPRLIEAGKFTGFQDRDSSRLRNFLDVETGTHRDLKISWMSRLRLIETEKFLGWWDLDSLRLGNLMEVETETSLDWAKEVDNETPSRLLLISSNHISFNTIIKLYHFKLGLKKNIQLKSNLQWQIYYFILIK